MRTGTSFSPPLIRLDFPSLLREIDDVSIRIVQIMLRERAIGSALHNFDLGLAGIQERRGFCQPLFYLRDTLNVKTKNLKTFGFNGRVLDQRKTESSIRQIDRFGIGLRYTLSVNFFHVKNKFVEIREPLVILRVNRGVPEQRQFGVISGSPAAHRDLHKIALGIIKAPIFKAAVLRARFQLDRLVQRRELFLARIFADLESDVID